MVWCDEWRPMSRFGLAISLTTVDDSAEAPGGPAAAATATGWPRWVAVQLLFAAPRRLPPPRLLLQPDRHRPEDGGGGGWDGQAVPTAGAALVVSYDMRRRGGVPAHAFEVAPTGAGTTGFVPATGGAVGRGLDLGLAFLLGGGPLAADHAQAISELFLELPPPATADLRRLRLQPQPAAGRSLAVGLASWGPSAGRPAEKLAAAAAEALPLLAALVNFKATAELLHSCPGDNPIPRSPSRSPASLLPAPSCRRPVADHAAHCKWHLHCMLTEQCVASSRPISAGGASRGATGTACRSWVRIARQLCRGLRRWVVHVSPTNGPLLRQAAAAGPPRCAAQKPDRCSIAGRQAERTALSTPRPRCRAAGWDARPPTSTV